MLVGMKRLYLILILFLGFFLRFYQLGSNPPSLYWDEASLGYNGYSIATSLKDEHGQFLPLDRFIAFGDYKPPGYIYAAAASIKAFGLDEFSVRFPSMLAGLLMIFITYLLVKEWFGKEKISLLASFFVAISPWSIHFSRGAFEAHLAALFNIIGIYLFTISKRKKWALPLAVISFIASFYTFNANRIIAPLLLLALTIINIKSIRENLKWAIISVILGVILILPSISFLLSPESKIRFQEVSIWNNLVPLQTSNEEIAYDQNAWWARLLHNRRIVYGMVYLKHYFDNFTGRFLFTHGDVNPRLNPQDMGELYPVELPLIVIGILYLVKKKEKALLPLFLWMAIVPIPAGAAKETPHALRILSILPAYQILVGYGLYQIIQKFKYLKTTSFLAVGLLFAASLFYVLHIYFIHFPANWSGEWQYGYKEMVRFVLDNEYKYDSVFVTEALGRPYIYFAFYKPYTQVEYNAARVETKDTFGFYNVTSLGKISFGSMHPEKLPGKILYVGTTDDTPSGFQVIKMIKNGAGDTVFVISNRI
jgi:4-amino-4-deoxy-L-arabinose transferase-like glycosyltransferase